MEPPELNWLSFVAAPMLTLRAGEVVAMNAIAAAMFGRTQEAIPLDLEVLIGPVAALAVRAVLPHGGREAADTLEVACTIAGAPRRLTVDARPLSPNSASSDSLWALTLADIGEAPACPAAGEDWVKLLPIILDRLPVALLIEDDSGLGVFVNRGFSDIFEYELGEIADIEDWWLKLYPDPVVRAEAERDWIETLAAAPAGDGTISTSEFQIRAGGGSDKMVQFHSFRLSGYRIHTYVDVTHRHRMAVDLRRLADTDGLTGVLNRRAFFEHAGRLIRAGGPFAALLLDVDHFKQVNDRLGHAFGDQVLVEIAARCRSALRAGDVLARLGGEEFAVLLPGQDTANTAAVAERLRSAIAGAPIGGTPDGHLVTISIGGACAMAGGSIEELLARADTALYAAKSGGRDCVRLDPETPY